jgi:hypothetical protein
MRTDDLLGSAQKRMLGVPTPMRGEALSDGYNERRA